MNLNSLGIEKIAIYPCSLYLDLAKLAVQRGHDVHNLCDVLMVKERSVNPVWEDSVTMAVNAVEKLNLSTQDKEAISLLIVCSETGVDHEKSISSWVHSFCKLPSSCRNFEIKSACYTGTAALRMALSYLATQDKGTKALIVTTDLSLIGIGEPYEYILGGGATALLISDQSDFLTILPTAQSGVYAHEVTDVIRPLPWLETGDSELSLLSYIESLTGAYQAFTDTTGVEQSFDEQFDFNVYHMPFAGISYRAHRTMLKQGRKFSKEEIEANFMRKVKPSLIYPQRIGGTYGGCIFVALLSLVANAPHIASSHRIGIFSYGSGACAEYYIALVGKKARQIAEGASVDRCLNNRLEVMVETYEALERSRVKQIKGGDFVPDFDFPQGCYAAHYKGKNRLFLQKIEHYYRHYAWS